MLAAISNGLRVYFLVNHMNKVELSLWIEANHPANAKSISKRKPRYGIGVNDASYVTTPLVDGARLMDPAYRAWAGILTRAYDQEFHAVNQTYIGVTVCEEWHSFRTFREWWLNNHREDCQLDKDLLAPGNREYSPDACIYIPSWLNKLTTDCGASRGEFPIGVSFCNQTGKYRSHCSNPIAGKDYSLGYFTTPEAAHSAWLRYKLELAYRLKPEMDAIDRHIYPNVVKIIRAAR